MAPVERAALRAVWFADLQAELDRRRAAALTANGGDPRQALLSTLDEIGDRLRLDPDFREPSTAQQHRIAQKMETWFRRHGYGLDPG